MAKREMLLGVKAVFCLGVLMAFSSCVSTEHDTLETAKAMATPIRFECRDGVSFSIAFSKKADTASLIFTGHSTPEILENRRLASGIEFGNDDYAFREHQGVTKLVDLTQDDEMETLCHRVQKK